VGYVVEFFAIAGEKDCACPWSIAYAYHVALDDCRTVGCWSERLIESSVAGGGVCEGELVEARKAEERVRFCGEANVYRGRFDSQ
jgi:hypothetical protein